MESVRSPDKRPPLWGLADNEFRVQLNPKGAARYSNMYRDPSGHTGVLEYVGPSNVGAVFMDEKSELSEDMWGDRTADAVGIVPGQLARKGKSYQVSTNMGPTIEESRDKMHHEAYHDASTMALDSEFMPRQFRDAYNFLTQPEMVSNLGIQVDEAITYHDQLYTASTDKFKDIAKKELQKMRKHAVDKLLTYKKSGRKAEVNVLEFWVKLLEPKNLDQWRRQVLRASEKRHEALGYK